MQCPGAGEQLHDLALSTLSPEQFPELILKPTFLCQDSFWMSLTWNPMQFPQGSLSSPGLEAQQMVKTSSTL